MNESTGLARYASLLKERIDALTEKPYATLSEVEKEFLILLREELRGAISANATYRSLIQKGLIAEDAATDA
jgi:hypothetical protein